MSIFSKLKFWEREDNPDFDSLAEKELNHLNPITASPLGEDPLFPEQPSPPSFQEIKPQQSGKIKDFELINSKLDTLKVMLDSIDRRLNNLEKTQLTQNKNRLW